MSSATREGPAGRGGVQSVTRAIALVSSLVDNDGGLTLSELARSAGLSVSTTHRLLHSLCEGDVLCRDPVTDRFIPGPLLMRLARSSIVNGGLSEASDTLQRLAASTRETASFVIRDGASVRVLLAVQSPEPLRFERQAGARLSLLSSAPGRALLAFAPEAIEDVVAVSTPIERVTPQTETDPSAVIAAVRAVRYRGWASLEQEHDMGIAAIAVPILGDGRAAHAAIALEGPASRLTRDRVEALGRELTAASNSLRHLPISMADMGTMNPTDMPPVMAD